MRLKDFGSKQCTHGLTCRSNIYIYLAVMKIQLLSFTFLNAVSQHAALDEHEISLIVFSLTAVSCCQSCPVSHKSSESMSFCNKQREQEILCSCSSDEAQLPRCNQTCHRTVTDDMTEGTTKAKTSLLQLSKRRRCNTTAFKAPLIDIFMATINLLNT